MRNKLYIFFRFCFFLLCPTAACPATYAINSCNSGIAYNPINSEDEILSPNTQAVSFENAVTITFYEGGASIDNPFENKGINILNNQGHVVITSTIEDTEVNYILSGVTGNGSLKIYGKHKQRLILNGVGITNPVGAAINNQCKKKTSVTVVPQTNNRLIDSATYTYTDKEDMKGTFFSEGSLGFYGTGNLEIRGKNKHAICVDNDFYLYESNIRIKEAASDAIHANNHIQIAGGSLTSYSNSEGLDCGKGSVEISAGTVEIITTGKKAHGIKSFEDISISKGNIHLSVLGDASKCLKSGGDILLAGGVIDLVTKGNSYYDTKYNDIASCAGIKCDYDLLIEGGDITVNSSGTGGKGINIDGDFTMNNGTLSITTTGSPYSYNFDSSASKALKCDLDMVINNGTISISTSGNGAEGMESKSKLYIHGGNIKIEAYDDCINASNHIEVTGGNIYCYSAANDGIDSNGTLTISGGTIVSIGSTVPEEGFDCDQNRFSITGGTIIGTGGGSSLPTPDASTQRSLVYRPSSLFIQNIRIKAENGEDILTFRLPRTYPEMTLLFSDPRLKTGTSYSIYTEGNLTETFTIDSMVTTVGNIHKDPGRRP